MTPLRGRKGNTVHIDTSHGAGFRDGKKGENVQHDVLHQLIHFKGGFLNQTVESRILQLALECRNDDWQVGKGYRFFHVTFVTTALALAAGCRYGNSREVTLTKTVSRGTKSCS